MAVMDETALIRASQNGDREAFNRLVVQYQKLVYNVATRILGEAAAADDASQEAFLSAFRHLHSYRGGSFRGWLLRIVTNACYDELRRRQRRPVAALEALTNTHPAPEAVAALSSQIESPDVAVQRHELAAAIQGCLDQLPEAMRTVVVLADVNGLDYSEVAMAMQSAVGTVKSRLARARGRLRDCLQAHAELLPAAYRLSQGIES